MYMAKNDITMRQCVRLARETIDSGKARAKLDEFIRATNEVA